MIIKTTGGLEISPVLTDAYGHSAVYSARVSGVNSEMTVAVYQGSNAEAVRNIGPLSNPLHNPSVGVVSGDHKVFVDSVRLPSFFTL